MLQFRGVAGIYIHDPHREDAEEENNGRKKKSGGGDARGGTRESRRTPSLFQLATGLILEESWKTRRKTYIEKRGETIRENSERRERTSRYNYV